MPKKNLSQEKFAVQNTEAIIKNAIDEAEKQFNDICNDMGKKLYEYAFYYVEGLNISANEKIGVFCAVAANMLCEVVRLMCENECSREDLDHMMKIHLDQLKKQTEKIFKGV